MKLNITGTCIIFLISITTTGCFKNEVIPRPVNSYAIEKSADYKHDSIKSKIINETTALYMSYPFSMQILLLTDEAIVPLIPLSDKGIMSQEYYLNAYIEEQDLIYEMFKKRKSFSKLHVEHIKKTNTAFNNKNYDFIMYFDSSTLGELDIYLKDTATDRTFLIWKEGMTKIDPIQKVENILKAKMIYCAFLESEKVEEKQPVKIIKKTNIQNKHVQNVNYANKIKKIDSISKIKQDSGLNDTAEDSTINTKDVKIANKIKKIDSISKIKQDSGLNDTAEDSTINTKDVKINNYYNAKRDSNGCYAYGTLNQCLVW